MHTEASHRFERGADPEAPAAATARIAHLLEKIGAGRARPGLIEALGDPRPRRRVSLRLGAGGRGARHRRPARARSSHPDRVGVRVGPPRRTETVEWASLPGAATCPARPTSWRRSAATTASTRSRPPCPRPACPEACVRAGPRASLARSAARCGTHRGHQLRPGGRGQGERSATEPTRSDGSRGRGPPEPALLRPGCACALASSRASSATCRRTSARAAGRGPLRDRERLRARPGRGGAAASKNGAWPSCSAARSGRATGPSGSGRRLLHREGPGGGSGRAPRRSGRGRERRGSACPPSFTPAGRRG